jgi:ATP-dependent Clp protease ATP-binding subunit ClpA
LKQNFIAPEHILLGLLRENGGLAAKVLADAGIDFAQLRQQAIEALKKAA